MNGLSVSNSTLLGGINGNISINFFDLIIAPLTEIKQPLSMAFSSSDLLPENQCKMDLNL